MHSKIKIHCPEYKREIVESHPDDEFYKNNSLFGNVICGIGIDHGERDVFDNAPVRVFDVCVLSHVYSGEGRFYLPESRFECRIRPGNVVIVTPGTPCVCAGVTEDFREDYCCFGGEDFDWMIKNGLIKSGCFYIGKKRELPMIADMLHIYTAEFRYFAFLKLQELLLDIYSRQRRDDRFRRIKELLETMQLDLRKVWSLEEMAEFCSCSTAQVRRNILDYTGMLPKECVENIKFRTAAEWLRGGRLSIDEICSQLGYSNRFHFSRRFKTFFGMPPGEFQKNSGNNLCHG